jgi:cytochrome c biogenesis protein CcdA
MKIKAVYSVGFSMPLALIMLGASFGKSVIRAKRAESAIRIVGGIMLIIAGFYFLATF